MTFKQGKFYISQLLNILSFLRQKNIIHRDLKPCNILMDENWHLILADFGTAKLYQARSSDLSVQSTSSSTSSIQNPKLQKMNSSNNLIVSSSQTQDLEVSHPDKKKSCAQNLIPDLEEIQAL